MKYCEKIEQDFSNCFDFKIKKIKTENNFYVIYYLEGMINNHDLSRFVIEKLHCAYSLEEAVENGVIAFCDSEKVAETDKMEDGILNGKTLVIDNNSAYIFDMRKTEKRSVDKPSEENSVRASKDSFVEEMKTNITLIRKKIISKELCTFKFVVGEQAKTKISLLYLKNIANDGLIENIKNIIKNINTDGVITPSIIEQAFSNRKFSVFPQTVTTERPDRVCRSLLSGRAAVIVDGIPVGFILPATLAQFLSTPEDYSGNYIFATVVKILRYFLVFIQLFLPGMYVALTTFHFEMIPPKLAVSIASAREGVPFPVLFEILSMLALFEVLVEAGLHMPESSGQAVSIVGALVVGEAAISANLVSPAALIIVAVSAVCSFAMPDQEFGNGIRLWRVLITLLGGMLGMFGITVGGLILLCEFASIENLGVPYVAPFAGIKKVSILKTLVVFPDGRKKFRPYELFTKNRRRMK